MLSFFPHLTCFHLTWLLSSLWHNQSGHSYSMIIVNSFCFLMLKWPRTPYFLSRIAFTSILLNTIWESIINSDRSICSDTNGERRPRLGDSSIWWVNTANKTIMSPKQLLPLAPGLAYTILAITDFWYRLGETKLTILHKFAAYLHLFIFYYMFIICILVKKKIFFTHILINTVCRHNNIRFYVCI